MIKTDVLSSTFQINIEKSIYYHLDVVKNKAWNSLYMPCLLTVMEKMYVFQTIFQNNDYATVNRKNKGQFTEKRGIAIIDTPWL